MSSVDSKPHSELARSVLERKHSYDFPDRVLAQAYLDLLEQLETYKVWLKCASDERDCIREQHDIWQSMAKTHADERTRLLEQLEAHRFCLSFTSIEELEAELRLKEQLEALQQKARQFLIATSGPPEKIEDVGKARRELVDALHASYPASSPNAGDLLVMPHSPGDPVPVGWTVEGDKMWRKADGTESAPAKRLS